MAAWGIAQAKAQLSEVVHQAEQGSPPTISRSGREVAVLISIEDWKRWNEEGTPAPKEVQDMADFIMNSPCTD